jgi:hypothetical protein
MPMGKQVLFYAAVLKDSVASYFDEDMPAQRSGAGLLHDFFPALHAVHRPLDRGPFLQGCRRAGSNLQ